jgi:uncharacterized membrane protein YkvA (DUF1232 family)
MASNAPAGGNRLSELFSMGQHAWRLFGDPRVPLAVKVIPMLAAIYVVMPVDILPDWLPGLGQLDDIAILLIGLRLFTQLAAKYEADNSSTTAATDQEVTTTYRLRED